MWTLVRAADSEQDGALFLTAAFTGPRMGELLALRWRDVAFPGATIRVRASYAAGPLTTPKSGKVRSVPLSMPGSRSCGEPDPYAAWLGVGRSGTGEFGHQPAE